MRADLPNKDSDAHFKSDRATIMARRLRKSMTAAECALWSELRRLPLKGTHFRRQAPFGPFIADFLCHRARLVIEVDGGVHEAASIALHDAERDAWISERGYRLLRFRNADVLRNPSEIARQIFEEAQKALPPC